ncbi:MAG: hypothetical protein AABX28_01780 [Nanoarchaeota archaeon]
MKSKNEKISTKKSKMKIARNLIIALVVIALAAAIVVYSMNKITIANTIKEQKEQEVYAEWLIDNCDCIEKDKIKCSDGFKLEGNLCRNETLKVFTNVLKACSKYECDGEIKVYNNKTGIWES